MASDYEHDELHFAVPDDEPTLENVDVKQATATDVCGSPGVFTVLGESHYVGIPELGYYEFCSCAPLDAEETWTLPLEDEVYEQWERRVNSRMVRTKAGTAPFAEFPGTERADVVYEFGEGAYTTLEVSGKNFKSFHTYPEKDLVFVTTTLFYPPE